MKIIDEMKDYSAKDWMSLAITIGLVVLIGLFAINQFLEFQYNSYLLSKPCELCLELNENIKIVPNIIGSNFSLIN